MTIPLSITIRARVLVEPRWWLPLCVIVMETGDMMVAWPVPVGVDRGLHGFTVRVEVRERSVRLPARLTRWLLGAR